MGTFVLCTDLPTATLSGYSLAVGVAIAEAIDVFGGRLELKWPNDLVTVRNGELFKIGGVLIEVEERSTFRAVLIGLGLNVSETPADVPTASSLCEAFAMRETVREIISPLAVSLLRAHKTFRTSGGFEAFRQRWLERSCFAVGRSWIKIDLGREVVAGFFQGVDANGALLLSVGQDLRVVHSGHVLEMRL
jgi:BirA family biotin operon repressor/biotin-[acetyl-CoA-carboxylase] ligase